MNLPREPITDKQLEAYLDGLLSPSERMALEDRLQDHPELAAEIDTQTRLDDSLRRRFRAPNLSEKQFQRLIHADLTESVISGSAVRRGRESRFRWMALAATTAAAIWALIVWQFGPRRPAEPYFEPRPLAAIYHETIARGFKPYYICDDPQRFALTFSVRQGIPLRLTPMPKGTRMLGLSYSGGLSRDTTAILCMVDDRPVIVFVDRLEADGPTAIQTEQDSDILVFRKEYHGLVLYEVTPFSRSRVLDHLVIVESGAHRLIKTQWTVQRPRSPAAIGGNWGLDSAHSALTDAPR